MKRFAVFFSAEDGGWIATCEGHPHLSWFALDPVAALQGLVCLVGDVEAGKA